ncbi:MAG: hypothetical protein U0984_05265 [Prosthecobacter sp.]|nr:hypothetical protein [Prosthecobacter sp.]
MKTHPLPVVESLEPRLAPAGVIAAIVAGGVLKLTGDAVDNGLTVTEISPDTLRLTGTGGTLISLSGAAGVATIDIANVDKGILADLKQGNDTLTISAAAFSGDVNVQLGIDDNTLTLADLALGGNLIVNGLNGTDTVSLSGTTLMVNGLTTINLGDGNNTTNLSPTGVVVFGTGLT